MSDCYWQPMLDVSPAQEVFTPKKHKDTGLPVTGREKVLQQCEQTNPIPFTECISPAMLNKCVKIGEGVYGEVFRTSNRRQSVALKIIPIEGDFEVNDEPQKTFDEILPEIVISRELSYLSEGDVNYSNNYIGVNNVSCVQGRYPETLLTQWDKYDSRKGSENDRPDIFDDEQLYIVFEFADGGQDLESFEFNNLQQAISIFQQTAGALAVAEKELEFEHRDLHWGNVLIRSTKQDHVIFYLDDQEYRIASHGLEVSIIDFTLSRLQKDECTIFCDLAADPTLFDGAGDYQFQIYRNMKKKTSINNWEPYEPHTNVLWLHYLADKLINSKTYQDSDTKAHKSALATLRSFYRHLLSHSSAEQVVVESELLDL
ncbi:serine/threonine-protein kinase haspin-like [Amphiura filiformis]|uniref:serine/threonine-protein kinase haspin-like n=1 Tax=Amphiura filiformis TaxID=82378 RepID=UPI003B214029